MPTNKYRCPICAAHKTIDGNAGKVYLVPHCDRCKIMMHKVPDGWEHPSYDTDL